MKIIFSLPGNEKIASELAKSIGAEFGEIDTRHFPDGETYVRIVSDVADHDVILVCTLAHPDDQFLRLIFTAGAAREMGAQSVTLVAPYLSYMRQDARFKPGEAVTSDHFAALLSKEFDRIITVDPHLHRHHDLSEIYTTPATTLHTTPLLVEWIKAHVDRPYIVGPDIESEQWVRGVADDVKAPYAVLTKERKGDREVVVSLPELKDGQDHTFVLLDDIVSSGRTMVAASERLSELGFSKPVCVVVHALFAEDAFARLSALASVIASTDTIPHSSNQISVAALLAGALKK